MPAVESIAGSWLDYQSRRVAASRKLALSMRDHHRPTPLFEKTMRIALPRAPRCCRDRGER